MASFDNQPMYKGESVVDHTAYWWTRFEGNVHWAMANGLHWKPIPWAFPEFDDDEFDEPDFHAHFQKLTDGVASEYSFSIEGEATVPEGILFRNDPEIGTGYQWSLFDPAKEVQHD